MTTRWPWLTMILAAAVALTPLARDIFDAAFISSARWMQDFWQFVYVAGVAILVLVALTEWGVRTMIIRRRARALVSEPAAAGEHKTES